MSKGIEGLEPKEGRFVRFGLMVDGWLVDYAIANDFKGVPELVRHIVREFKQAHKPEVKDSSSPSSSQPSRAKAKTATKSKPRLVEKATA
jgi:hypothetical protein